MVDSKRELFLKYIEQKEKLRRTQDELFEHICQFFDLDNEGGEVTSVEFGTNTCYAKVRIENGNLFDEIYEFPLEFLCEEDPSYGRQRYKKWLGLKESSEMIKTRKKKEKEEYAMFLKLKEKYKEIFQNEDT